jgi:hypothetical protein
LGRTLRFVFFTSVLNKESSVLHGVIDVYLIKSLPAEQWIILDQLTFNGDGMIQRGGMHLKDGEGNDLKDDYGEPIHIESRSDNALLILAVEVLEKGLRFQGNYL